jgi:hypothetical protein
LQTNRNNLNSIPSISILAAAAASAPKIDLRTVDYSILLVCILVVGGIGRVRQKHVKSASDFLTSGRRLLQ